MADDDQSVSVHWKDLLDMSAVGLAGDDLTTFREIVERKAIKVELEVIIPGSKNKDEALAAAKDYCKKAGQLLAKQAAVAFPIVVECYREDKQGSSKAFGEAEAALTKFNKFAEQQVEHFRVELRQAIAAKIGGKAKELMTVGRVSFKEASIVSGSFQGETTIDKQDNSDANEKDIKTALKRKSWQQLGVAFGSKEARIAINKTKAFTPSSLKALAELHPEKERATLKYAHGRIQAGGESDIDIEFLASAKLPGNADRVGQLIRLGLLSQINKLVTVEVRAKLPEFTSDGKSKKEKEKEKVASTSTSTAQSTTTTTGSAKGPKGKVGSS